jgi:hypothetical protein
MEFLPAEDLPTSELACSLAFTILFMNSDVADAGPDIWGGCGPCINCRPSFRLATSGSRGSMIDTFWLSYSERGVSLFVGFLEH